MLLHWLLGFPTSCCHKLKCSAMLTCYVSQHIFSSSVVSDGFVGVSFFAAYTDHQLVNKSTRTTITEFMMLQDQTRTAGGLLVIQKMKPSPVTIQLWTLRGKICFVQRLFPVCMYLARIENSAKFCFSQSTTRVCKDFAGWKDPLQMQSFWSPRTLYICEDLPVQRTQHVSMWTHSASLPFRCSEIVFFLLLLSWSMTQVCTFRVWMVYHKTKPRSLTLR